MLEFVRKALIDALDPVSQYPSVIGQKRLRESVAGWARRRLDALVDQLEPKAARRRDPGRPIAGTQLRRQWRDIEHVVTVREHDFEYQGRPYKSLSAIARQITNVNWNGWAFFGLRRNGKAG